MSFHLHVLRMAVDEYANRGAPEAGGTLYGSEFTDSHAFIAELFVAH